MKVLVVGTGGAIVSGITTAADQMARTLADRGYEVERASAGVKMRRRPNAVNLENVLAVFGDALVVARHARRSRTQLVWIHAMGVPFLPALRVLALVLGARLVGRPAVVRFHAFDLAGSVDRGGRPLRIVLRVIASQARWLVAEHDSAAAALLRATGSTKVQTLHNWVEVPGAPAPLPAMPPLRLVFVGGLVRRKGVHILIEAMRLMDDVAVELCLVGGAGEDGDAALEELVASAADLVGRGRLVIAGEKDAGGVRGELRRAHVLVLPSEAEGMPLAMLEAMAEGRAILVTGAGNMRAVIEDTGAGWVLSDREPRCIASAIRTIAADEPSLSAAGLRGYEAVLAMFSSDAIGEQLDCLVEADRSER